MIPYGFDRGINNDVAFALHPLSEARYVDDKRKFEPGGTTEMTIMQALTFGHISSPKHGPSNLPSASSNLSWLERRAAKRYESATGMDRSISELRAESDARVGKPGTLRRPVG